MQLPGLPEPELPIFMIISTSRTKNSPILSTLHLLRRRQESSFEADLWELNRKGRLSPPYP